MAKYLLILIVAAGLAIGVYYAVSNNLLTVPSVPSLPISTKDSDRLTDMVSNEKADRAEFEKMSAEDNLDAFEAELEELDEMGQSFEKDLGQL